MFKIENDGKDIRKTDYWDTEHANSGLCYLTGNAGALRLLVPEAAEGLLPEMRTGTKVLIEASVRDTRCIDIVFEDGTEEPFALSLDRKQIERSLGPGKNIAFSVWTERGCQLQLTAEVRP